MLLKSRGAAEETTVLRLKAGLRTILCHRTSTVGEWLRQVCIMDEIRRGVRLDIDWPLAHGGVLRNCVATITKIVPHRKRPIRLVFEDAIKLYSLNVSVFAEVGKL